MRRHDEWFTVAYAQFHPQIVRFVQAMLAGRGDAADVAHDVFLRLHTSGPAAADATHVRFWLFRVARNLALNELRHWRVRDAVAPLLALLHAHPAQPDELALRAERRRMLTEKLALLTANQRAALLLREWEEMSYDEIAATLEVSVANVKSDLFRARQSLRAALDPDRRKR